MFGRILNHWAVISVILIGFCLYIVRLFVSGSINLYIHPRYSYFSVAMSVLAMVVLMTGVVVELRKKRRDHHVTHDTGKTINVIVAVILMLAFILPARPLSSDAIGQRTLQTPMRSDVQMTAAKRYTRSLCPNIQPETINAWVYVLSEYPLHCYEGENIVITGFVVQSFDSPLPSDMYYLGRVTMSCCAIDAQPYALPVKKDDKIYPVDSWWTVQGTLEPAVVNGIEQLIVEPQQVTNIEQPEDPYDYL